MNRLLLTALLFFAVPTSHALSTTENKDIIIKNDDFDGSRTISTNGLLLRCGDSIWDPCSYLHLEHTNKKPNQITVTAKVFGQIKNNTTVKQLAIKSDGKIKTYDAIGNTNVSNSQFSHNFTLPLKELQKLNNAQNIQVRIITNNGNFDGTLKDSEKQTQAAQTFLDFYKAVQANKPTQK